jgi:hypothetical protein
MVYVISLKDDIRMFSMMSFDNDIDGRRINEKALKQEEGPP